MFALFSPGGVLSRALDEYEPRPGQMRMAEMVLQSFADEEKLVVEAGTGTGKTCAYLIPAVLSGRKVIISTGTKNLEEQIFHKDIPLLKKTRELKFSAALMKGRRNYLCLRRWKRFLREPMFDFAWEGRHLDKIAKWAERTKSGDRSEIKGLPDNYRAWRDMSSGSENCAGSKCPESASCFVMRMRSMAQEADVVVVNHALFFSDLSLRSDLEGLSVIPRYDAVIFDEAHLIESAATSHFGIEVSNAGIDDIIRDISKAMAMDKVRSSEVERASLGLQSMAGNFFESLGGPTQGERVDKRRIHQTTAQAGAQLMEMLDNLGRLISGLKGEEDWGRLSERAHRYAENVRFLMEQPQPDYVYWRERRDRWSVFRASPIDLSPIFAELLYPTTPTIVFTSATLSVAGSFEHFKSSIGLNGNTSDGTVGTPFDVKNQAVLYVPGDLPDPDSNGYMEALASEIDKLVKLVGGRAFLLFTSYRVLEEMYKRLADGFSMNVLKQGDAPRSEILESFREEPSVLFATQSFWQGVDVMGSALSLVVVDKLPFAVPSDPIVESRIDWIRKNGGEPFMQYQLPHAVLMLKQGLGRLLRHRNDRGILAILDPRIHTRRYGAAVKKSLADFRVTRAWDDVERFARSNRLQVS